MELVELKTPSLLLDRAVLERNCRRMAERMERSGVSLRPHLKTAKSLEVAKLAANDETRAITVSTLAEARYFLKGGFPNIVYAVGMVPDKADEAAWLQSEGANLILVTDNVEAARELGMKAAALGCRFQVLIEIDSGGGRAGLDPASDDILALGQAIHAHSNLALMGVLTHAGHSYQHQGLEQLQIIAEQERSAVLRAARSLRASGLPCPIVSAGSTPTAIAATRFDGLTEMRPGVYVFNDLDQVGIGSCSMDDLAVSVLTSVIGHNRRTGRILVDAGGLALSKDTSAQKFMKNVGYGLVCDTRCQRIPHLYVNDVHQEHGLIATSNGALAFEDFPVGRRLRILPNHVCMTAAAFDRYAVIDRNNQVVDEWRRTNGWS